MHGEVTVKQHLDDADRHQDDGRQRVMSSSSSDDSLQESEVVLKADPTALREIIGTSAEDWRRRQMDSSSWVESGRQGCPYLASMYWSEREKSSQIALLQPMNV